MIRQRQHGFTLVEMIVVIAVIGILAALTLITYDKVQSRAQDSKIRSAATTLAKAIVTWASDNQYTSIREAGVNYQSSSPISADGTCSGGNGSGYIQKGVYQCTLEDVLVAKRYIPSDLLLNLPPAGLSSNGVFMTYPCGLSTSSAWVLYYRVNIPLDAETKVFNERVASCNHAVVANYGMNAAKPLQL